MAVSVLPIKDPDGVPIINKITGEQVIVARLWPVQFPKGLLDLFHQGKNLGERLGEGDAMFECQLMIVAHRLKR